MATAKKGNGAAAVRRRTKSAAKDPAGMVQQGDGVPARNGAVGAASNGAVNVESIRARAYELFLARGATHGNDVADWLDAERELLGPHRP